MTCKAIRKRTWWGLPRNHGRPCASMANLTSRSGARWRPGACPACPSKDHSTRDSFQQAESGTILAAFGGTRMSSTKVQGEGTEAYQQSVEEVLAALDTDARSGLSTGE